jgi:hypothetical protein
MGWQSQKLERRDEVESTRVSAGHLAALLDSPGIDDTEKSSRGL